MIQHSHQASDECLTGGRVVRCPRGALRYEQPDNLRERVDQVVGGLATEGAGDSAQGAFADETGDRAAAGGGAPADFGELGIREANW
ncbi:MAG TPA: hypothetical protein VNW46_19160 [Gemmatimonadaceae bacterium]|nr:hypothetical protein [Gemmatimonadaceae bacterium]